MELFLLKQDSNNKAEGDFEDSLDGSSLSETISSDLCIYIVSWTCLAVFIWNHFWLIHFLPITILTYVIKNLGEPNVFT